MQDHTSVLDPPRVSQRYRNMLDAQEADERSENEPPDFSSTKARKLPQYIAAFIVALGAFGLGMVVGWSATAVEKLRDDLPLTVTDVSWLGSIVNLAAAVVMLPLALLMKVMGRRTVMLVMAPAFTLSWIVLALARSVPWLLVARFFTGLCGGVFSVVGPIYNGEVADKKVRGALGTFYQLFLCTGLVTAYVIGNWGSLLTLNLCSAAVPALFFGLAWLVPETPVYLMEHGDDPGAERALRWLRGPRYDIAREMVLIAEYLEQMRAKEIGLRKAFATRAATRALVISAVTMTIQQASGIKPVVFYTVSIFKGAGSDIDPYVATVITGVVLAAATLVSTLLVDRWGRRRMLLISGVLTTTCHLVIGAHYYRGANSSMGWLPLAALCAYLVTYSAGYGAVPWVLLGELFPPEIKEIAGPICSSVNWLVAFVVSIVFPMSVSSLGFAASFWLLGLFCFLGFVFVFVFVVETKGKTLEEIQEQLENTSYFNFKL